MRRFFNMLIGFSLFVSSLSAQTDHDIYFARSTDGGASWSDPNIRVDDGALGHQAAPCLKVDGNGYIWVTWTDRRSSDYDVYFARSLDGGFSWTNPNIKVNDQAGGDQGPSCHSLGYDGDVYVAWADTRFPGDSDIYFGRSTDGGSVWTDPNIQITDPQSWAALGVSLDLDAQGRIYAVWADERDLNFDIFFAKSVDGGTTWTDPNIRVNPSIPGDQERPDIAVDVPGTLYVAYEDHVGPRVPICFTKSTDGGLSWTEPVPVDDSASTGLRWRPAIALGGDGGVNVVWWDYRASNSYVYFARSTDGGSTWTDPNIQVNDGLRNAEVWMPISMEVDSAGNISVVWPEFFERTPGVWDYDIYFARSTDGGVSWTYPNVRINDDTLGFQHSPSLDIGPDGTIYVAWQDERNSVGVQETVSPPPLPSFTLLQNHPNPFGSGTSIGYGVASPGQIRLNIYDVAGRLVNTLVDGEHQPGYYTATWNGRDSSGRHVPSGVYFYRLEAEVPAVSRAELPAATRKMIVLR